MKKLFILCLMVTASFFMVVNTGQAAVPNPTVTGPILATATPGDPSRNYPFFASQFDLAARGYVEEEYFIAGTANRYNLVSGQLTTATILASGYPYKTRIVVRRPASPKKFTGTVFVEWTNVTNQCDMENTWFQIHEYVLRSGHAWVGVSAQRVGVNALKAWNGVRYGSLNVEYTTVPPSTSTDDLSYDIFSQAVQAIRSPIGINPLGNLSPEVIIATGHSQSASRLGIYVNTIEPLALVIDAFALHGGGSIIRTDLVVPVWKALAEFDVEGFSQANYRRPDNQTFATWEVTGTMHNDMHSYASRVFLENRDNGSNVEAALVTCDHQPVGSTIPFRYAMAAGLSHLIRWVKDGTPMPSAPQLEVQSYGPVVLARDIFGNAIGGLRLSQVEVPIAVSAPNSGSPTTCARWGYTEPFSDAILKSLYRNHGSYVSQVSQVTSENEHKGYILKEDAQQTIVEAAQSSIGQKK